MHRRGQACTRRGGREVTFLSLTGEGAVFSLKSLVGISYTLPISRQDLRSD